MRKSFLKSAYNALGIADKPTVRKQVKKLYAFYSKKQFAAYKKLYVLSPTYFVNHVTGFKIHGGVNFMQTASKYMPYYLSKTELLDKAKMEEMKKDMVKCYFLYGINPEEYLIHSFSEKPQDEREKYISKKVKDENIAKQLGKNSEKAYEELKNKYLFYQLVPQFFKRDVCRLYSKNDSASFISFVQKHHRFIVKPVSGRFGAGTNILDLADFNGNAEAMIDHLLKDNRWIIEELINQDERMAVWNESSVNTIRIPSFRTKEGYKILHPFIRMGRKGSVVDNGGSGGIMAAIDVNTGCICTRARDERGNIYSVNPDNGMAFENWCVPEWEELIKLSRRVHESLPLYHKYVGFDFALSQDKGWQLVEGNWGDFICQQSTHGYGMKKEFLDLLYG